MAGLVTASRGFTRLAQANYLAQLGQAELRVPSTSLKEGSETWMPGTRPGMTSKLRKGVPWSSTIPLKCR
jgi:hypothetical protein